MLLIQIRHRRHGYRRSLSFLNILLRAIRQDSARFLRRFCRCCYLVYIVLVRVKKTLREIRSAIMELAKNKPLEQITVKELCEQALINKATFYSHYDNINALLEEIEDEFVKNLTGEIEYAHLSFDDPEQFIAKLNHTFRELPDAFIRASG